MMELFLNLLWVAIAVIAFGFWRTRWLRERPKNRRNPLREWTAFACALVLLFFAVSLTDDLHSELMVFDECCASRRHSSALVCPHHSPQEGLLKQHSGTGVLPAVTSFGTLQRLGTVVLQAGFTHTLFTARFAAGRAPPADLV
jgi:hypothetical protein